MRARALLVTILLFCASALGAEGPAAAPRWFPGDCGVLVWPWADFSAAERIDQGRAGGLSWAALCHVVRSGGLADVDAASRFRKLEPEGLTAMFGLRFENPAPLSEDIICLGGDPELPLPRLGAQEVIDWANALGGVAILSNPGSKLSRYADRLTGFAAFEAFSAGAWNPECAEGQAWDRLLARGKRIFIVGGSSEATRPVLGRGSAATYVLARDNSEAEVLAAIRAGRAIVAERDLIRMNFSVDGQPPGSAIPAGKGKVEVTVEVSSSEDIDEVLIIGNARAYGRVGIVIDNTVVFRSIPVRSKQAAETFTLELDESTRYLRAVAVIHKGGCKTLTNPVFIGTEGQPHPAADTRERNEALVRTAMTSLDWSDGALVRAAVSRLLGDREIGPCAALVMAKELDKRQLNELRPLLEWHDPRVRALTAFILARTESEGALPSLIPMLRDSDCAPRLFATGVLARFGGVEHLALARRAASDLWPEVRQYGLAALARIAGPDALAELNDSLLDRSSAVRQAAATQLSLLLGVEPANGKKFIEALTSGKLDDELLETAVSKAELRPLVREAAAQRLAKVQQLKPVEAGPVAEQAPAPEKPVFRSLSAAAAPVRPVMDGKADDQVWKGAVPAGEFILADGSPAGRQTSVRAAYDSENLYLLFECAEPEPQEIIARENQRDGNVWLDDSVDVYVCSDAKRSEKNPLYFRFSTNSRGVQFDEARMRRQWDTTWEAAASVGGEDWTLEMAVPFRSLGAKGPVPGETRWLVNFVRHRRVAPQEDSSFASGDPRTPATYAELRFE